MGICFVGEKRKFHDFISQYITPKPGLIINLETGLQVGERAGPWNFTIGQGAKVKGLKEKTFVVKKDIPKNIIYVVPGMDHPALHAQSLTVRDWTWIWADSLPKELMHPGGLKACITNLRNPAWQPCSQLIGPLTSTPSSTAGNQPLPQTL
ncbi:tRNA methyl transferase-domain-containing protein [Suillus variegatus]|nr:tRNA methyl transferase-domain-containing protein [Suillus variegatus]